MTIQERIRSLAREKGAVILAHYYQTAEVKEVANFIGDSLAMAQWAAKQDAKTIVVAGVKFMAETAALLAPNTNVLSPDIDASCSLADNCPEEGFAEFVASHSDRAVVTYVNSSIGVKALSDVTCTSSNAVDVINSIPKSKGIVFAPDKNLGSWLQKITGRDIVCWDATCEVHDKFSVDMIRGLKNKYPDAIVIAHPECKPEMLSIADHIGSTSSLLSFVANRPLGTYIVATEVGIVDQMKDVAPNAAIIAAPQITPNSCACGECPHMKRITLSKIELALLTNSTRIDISDSVRKRAALPIQRMMQVKPKPTLV